MACASLRWVSYLLLSVTVRERGVSYSWFVLCYQGRVSQVARVACAALRCSTDSCCVVRSGRGVRCSWANRLHLKFTRCYFSAIVVVVSS